MYVLVIREYDTVRILHTNNTFRFPQTWDENELQIFNDKEQALKARESFEKEASDRNIGIATVEDLVEACYQATRCQKRLNKRNQKRKRKFAENTKLVNLEQPRVMVLNAERDESMDYFVFEKIEITHLMISKHNAVHGCVCKVIEPGDSPAFPFYTYDDEYDAVFAEDRCYVDAK